MKMLTWPVNLLELLTGCPNLGHTTLHGIKLKGRPLDEEAELKNINKVVEGLVTKNLFN